MIGTLCIMSLYVSVYQVFLCVCLCIFFPQCGPVYHVSCLCKGVPCLPLHVYQVSVFTSVWCLLVCEHEYHDSCVNLCVMSPCGCTCVSCFFVCTCLSCLSVSTFETRKIHHIWDIWINLFGQGQGEKVFPLSHVGDSKNNGWEM